MLLFLARLSFKRATSAGGTLITIPMIEITSSTDQGIVATFNGPSSVEIDQLMRKKNLVLGFDNGLPCTRGKLGDLRDSFCSSRFSTLYWPPVGDTWESVSGSIPFMTAEFPKFWIESRTSSTWTCCSGVSEFGQATLACMGVHGSRAFDITSIVNADRNGCSTKILKKGRQCCL